MCGIVGYIGGDQAVPVLLNGLSKLEYRGYDSAGISVYEDGIRTIKVKGRLAGLAEKLEKDGQKIADLFASMNRFNMPKVKEEIETKFPAWVKQVEILSAQISSANIGISLWKRKAAEAKRSSREASEQIGKMKTEVMNLYSQVSDLQRYVKYMPPEVKQQYKEARENAMRMLHGEFDR